MKALLLAMVFSTQAGLAQELVPLPPAEPEARVLPGFTPPVTRSFAQFVWNAARGALDRRIYRFDDPLAEAEILDLFFEASTPEVDTSGPLQGQGRLVWREPGLAGLAPGGIVASYEGGFSNGRFDGHGIFSHRSGARYDGEWHDGMMHGEGRLTLPSGDGYVGSFAKSRRSGSGSYVDRFGTVYDGGFVQGLRDGEGRVYSAASPAYRARWRDGIELPGTRVPLQGVPAPLPSQYQDWADVAVSVAVLPADQTLYPTPMQYVGASEGETLFVYPGDQRLLNAWQGIENIANQGAPSESYFGLPERYQPVALQVGLENRSVVPTRILGAYIDVASTRSERRPLMIASARSTAKACVYPQQRELPICKSGNVEKILQVENRGWAMAENVVLDLGFLTSDGAPMTGTMKLPLPAIAAATDIDMSEALSGMGINLPFVNENSFPCDTPESCVIMAKDSGAYGQLADGLFARRGYIFLRMAGHLSYDWAEADGRRPSARVPVAFDIMVGAGKSAAELGEGGEPEPLRIPPFLLPVDQGPSRVPLPLAADVPAGRIGAWMMQLATPMSATSEFRVVLQLADGRQIASRPVRLLYLVPNLWPGG